MDLEYTFWQMLYLCLNPSAVYVLSKAPAHHEKRMLKL